MNPRIKSQDARAFAVAVSDSLFIVWNLAGVMTSIVGKGTFEPSSFIVHLGFPLHISGRAELGDLIPRPADRSEATDSPVHDITRNPLNAIDKIIVVLFVERAVIDLPTVEIRIVNPGHDVRDGQRIGVINQYAAYELIRVRRLPAIGSIDPAGTVIVVPLTPRQGIIAIMGVHGHRQAQLTQIVHTRRPVRLFFGFG